MHRFPTLQALSTFFANVIRQSTALVGYHRINSSFQVYDHECLFRLSFCTVHENICSSRVKSHISLLVVPLSNYQITTPSFGTFRRKIHILYGEVTGRHPKKQTRSFPNREITCRHCAYSREKSNFVSAFGYPPPTLDSPRLSIKVGYYALSNISCCEIRGPHGADKRLYDLPVISLD